MKFDEKIRKIHNMAYYFLILMLKKETIWILTFFIKRCNNFEKLRNKKKI